MTFELVACAMARTQKQTGMSKSVLAHIRLGYLGVKVVGYLSGLGGHVGPTGHCDDLAGHPQQRVQNKAQLNGAYPLLGANKGAGLVPYTQMQA